MASLHQIYPPGDRPVYSRENHLIDHLSIRHGSVSPPPRSVLPPDKLCCTSSNVYNKEYVTSVSHTNLRDNRITTCNVKAALTQTNGPVSSPLSRKRSRRSSSQSSTTISSFPRPQRRYSKTCTFTAWSNPLSCYGIRYCLFRQIGPRSGTIQFGQDTRPPVSQALECSVQVHPVVRPRNKRYVSCFSLLASSLFLVQKLAQLADVLPAKHPKYCLLIIWPSLRRWI